MALLAVAALLNANSFKPELFAELKMEFVM